ncbi:hypothetical protein CO251_11625 [Sulfobacillus sp. hq2]|nr:hypothetical protein CO251_11625 [Sulfobacillus sp. hq2]
MAPCAYPRTAHKAVSSAFEVRVDKQVNLSRRPDSTIGGFAPGASAAVMSSIIHPVARMDYSVRDQDHEYAR